MLEEGKYYLYDGPTWLSGEVSYGDTLKFLGMSGMGTFATVQKLGVDFVLRFDVPAVHLKPLRYGPFGASKINPDAYINATKSEATESNKQWLPNLTIRWEWNCDKCTFHSHTLAEAKVHLNQHYGSGVEQLEPYYIGYSEDGITMDDLNHKTTLEEHEANLPKTRDIHEDFVKFKKFLEWMIPAGKCRENSFARLDEAELWASKGISRRGFIPENVDDEEKLEPKIEFNIDESALKGLLKKTLLEKYAGWREYNETDYDFLVRLTRKGTINPEEFAAVYGKRIHEVYDPEVDDPTPDTNANG